MGRAIVVKYLGATEKKPTRLKVQAKDVKAMYVSRDYEYNVDEQSLQAALQYVTKLKWKAKRLVSGVLPNGDHVIVIDN